MARTAKSYRRILEDWVREYAAETDADPDSLRDWLSDSDLTAYESPSDFMLGDGKRDQPSFFRWWKAEHSTSRDVKQAERAAGEEYEGVKASAMEQLRYLAKRLGGRVHRHHGRNKERVTVEIAFPSGEASWPTDYRSLAAHFCATCGDACTISQSGGGR